MNKRTWANTQLATSQLLYYKQLCLSKLANPKTESSIFLGSTNDALLRPNSSKDLGVSYGSVLFQLAFFNIPLMAYMCWSLLQRCFGHNFRSHLHQRKYLKIMPVHLLMLLLYIWQVYSCYFLYATYGTLAFLFSPLRTWLTLLTPVLIRCVWTLNSAKLGIFMVQLKSHLSS